MIFREATSDHVERIAQLHARSWQATYRGIYPDEFLDGDVLKNRLAVWTSRILAPPSNQYVMIAEQGVEILGFACVYGDKDAKWGSLLDNLHVQPEHKSLGVGTQLIKRAANWSREMYAQCKFYLWVFEKNRAARHFYERLGGTHSESIETEVPGGGIAVECRYTWLDPIAIVAAIEKSSGNYSQVIR
jgi:GNAT superfamily N-acetyltransferase